MSRGKRLVVTSWLPISQYDPVKYDWVLLDVYDSVDGMRFIPRVGEYNAVWRKWFFIGEDEPIDESVYEIRGFFDMQQLGERMYD